MGRQRCGPKVRCCTAHCSIGDRRSNLGDLHGILRRHTRATNQVGCMARKRPIAGGQMANPIARKVDSLVGDEGEDRRQ